MIKILNWTENDFPLVQQILKETWLDTYSSFIPIEDLTGYLETAYSVEALSNLYKDANNTGLFAFENKKPVAWMRTHLSSEDKRFYVSSIYVLPGNQGKGIGKLLLQKAAELAKLNDFDRIYLGVMKQNAKSLAWYKKEGFVFEEEQPFTMGNTSVPHLIGYCLI
ncbi:MAG: GNAT family N-acetyltransferase [Ignavibacteriales bacterium]|nr:GNAT family N-acetyltransferase [Ignavibacteriales bacterium]